MTSTSPCTVGPPKGASWQEPPKRQKSVTQKSAQMALKGEKIDVIAGGAEIRPGFVKRKPVRVIMHAET